MNDMTARTAPFDIHDRPKDACPDCGVALRDLDRRARNTCHPPKPRPVERLRCPDCRDTGGRELPGGRIIWCETCWGLPSGTPEQIAANREAILAVRAAEDAEEHARLTDPNYRAPLERLDPGKYE